MKTLSIDIETFSSVGLTESGVYRYVESPDFEILLLAYAYNDDPVSLIDLAQGEPLPESLINDLQSLDVIKTAFNAQFEITCLNEFFSLIGGYFTNASSWRCTMVHGYYLGLSGGLGALAKAIGIENEKDPIGKGLIKYFSLPCKPTKVNGGRTRNLPRHNPEKWGAFKKYCKQDVEVERELKHKFSSMYTIPDCEHELWCLDQKINKAGISVCPPLIKNALECDTIQKEKLTRKAAELSGLENPNSKDQIKKWLLLNESMTVKSLTKDTMPEIMEQVEKAESKELLSLIKKLSKTSVAKYEAMDNCRCIDGKLRGLLRFYGASRTGRWAGGLVQPHNLPKNEMPDLDTARNFLLEGDYEALEMIYPSVTEVLSQLIRTAFVPENGRKFIISDFSAIEARVIAWLASEEWRLDVFNSHGKIYEASAAQMFKVPIETVTKGSPLRQKGKVAELALGYQGGPPALIRMGALTMGLREDELPELVSVWRSSNPKIKKLWETVEKAAITAVEKNAVVKIDKNVIIGRQNNMLKIKLPSGRVLCYLDVETKEGKRFGNKVVAYKGVNQNTKKIATLEAYGGKLVENIVQAIARDCLAAALARIDKAGYKIVLHVHDEVVIEAPESEDCLGEINAIMSTPIEWAKGLPLKGDSYEAGYYKKD